MTPTEKARRKDALMQDTYRYHRETLCYMVADREADIERLEVEHARAMQANVKWMAKAAHFEAERDKLRELLTFYLGCLTKGHVNCDSCTFKYNCGHGQEIIDKARELGIEVE